MKITIEEITPERLGEYANIPNAFMVRSIYQVESVDKGLGGMSMIEVPVEHPYIKDYDLEESPEDWPIKFNVANWGFFLAKADQRTVGAAAVAFDTTGVFMLEARRDLAVLWDIRVCPEYRGAGIPFFWQTAKWSRARGCTQMKIETQNINVPACRFYQRRGLAWEKSIVMDMRLSRGYRMR